STERAGLFAGGDPRPRRDGCDAPRAREHTVRHARSCPAHHLLARMNGLPGRVPATTDSGRVTTMPLARSFLYVPANRERFLEKAIGLPSDAFIFDLEDSVPPAEKANARAGVREYAPKIAGGRGWVRVNGLETGLADDDLDAVVGVGGLAGFFLPKVETPDEVRRGDAMIGLLEGARGVAAGALKLVISIESALGVLNAYAMATAAARVVSLTFGGAQDGDLNTDLGCAW